MNEQTGGESFKSAQRVTRTPGSVSFSGSLLFIFPIPLFMAVAVSLGRGDFSGVLGNASAAILFLIGALTLRKGLQTERVYNAKKVAVAPKLPLKLAASIIVGVAVALAAKIGADHGFLVAVCFGIGAAAGCILTYGTDPRKEKVAKAGYGYTTAEVVAALEEAEQRVRKIESARHHIHNQELKDRLSRIVVLARKVLSVIEDDPRDLRRARKFLNTYLEGARKVTEGYATTHKKTQSNDLEANFRNVLVTIEEVFDEQHRRLLQNDVLDLDVQIEVLATQLEREGIL